jgi:hypothetical protein
MPEETTKRNKINLQFSTSVKYSNIAVCVFAFGNIYI